MVSTRSDPQQPVREQLPRPVGAASPDELLDHLAELAPDPLIVVDEHGVIVLASAQAEALTGYPRTDLVGRRVDNLLHDPDRRRGDRPC